ncbi:hypothetical protein ElyMa_003994400 [Elysia marginata]|uniref:Uncharacterized protein n=1 Tax=Elysia marginata TaxID=1093978 RepID=A0AAV4G1L7_9GAST|nr:hypothetical protein ElyMa_003994400 [Elysia marginata]
MMMMMMIEAPKPGFSRLHSRPGTVRVPACFHSPNLTLSLLISLAPPPSPPLPPPHLLLSSRDQLELRSRTT